MRKWLVLAFVLMFASAPSVVLAQQAAPGAPVTQTGSTGLAAQVCLATAAAVTSQQTQTIPSPGGNNSIYIDFLSLSANAIGAVTTSATVLTFTTTNIAGTPSFAVSSGVGGGGNLAAGGGQAVAAGATGPLAIPIKALAGTSPTIVGPTATTNLQTNAVSCWHVAP